MRSRGLFITVEGGEGVGKSTNITYLAEQLQQRGVELVVTREPGGTALAESIRNVLLEVREESVGELTELLLMFAARAQHIEKLIEPALSAGKWVLSDRFTDATYAYQCGGRGVSVSLVRQLEHLVQGELRPDYTLLLDAPIDTGMSRARERGELDRFEREDRDFFQRVRDTYLQLAQESSGRFHVIDASLTLPEVQGTIDKICDELLQCWGVRRK
ncbi:MAG: dTMP kinase [Proteobacteria bacterium]|nr:dTMP kinase [Pseudomonadota bacterium]